MVGFVLHIIMYVLSEERNAEETSVPVLRPASRSSCTCGVLLIKNGLFIMIPRLRAVKTTVAPAAGTLSAAQQSACRG